MFGLFTRNVAASRSALRSSSRQISSSAARNDAQAEAKKAAAGASKQFEGALEKAKQFGQTVGQKAQPYVGSYADPLIYNLKVIGNIAKQVYIAESLAPPKSVATIVDSYKTFYSRAINKEYYQRLLKTGEWKKVAIYGLEAYGIFSIGEMIGRRSLIGYDLQKHGDDHH
ncbi:unnamed protein product [Sympodiomycopsis kandeliae]